MGRKNGGDSNTKVGSSIALLQERFRQLQKVKERREERELLRMLSESERMSPRPFQSNGVPFPQTNRPTTTATSRDRSLSLELDLHSKQPDPASSRSLWHDASASTSSSKRFDNPDNIDTSLHL